MLLQGRSPECFVASRLSLAAIAGPQPFTLCRQLQGAEPGEGTGEAGREGVRSEAKRPSFAPLCSSLLLFAACACRRCHKGEMELAMAPTEARQSGTRFSRFSLLA